MHLPNISTFFAPNRFCCRWCQNTLHSESLACWWQCQHSMANDVLQSLISDHFQVNFLGRNRLRNHNKQNEGNIFCLQGQKYRFLQVFQILSVGFMNTPWKKITNCGFTSFGVTVIVIVSIPQFPTMNTLIHITIMLKSTMRLR